MSRRRRDVELSQSRRDEAAEWTSVDPVLKSGEIGFETDTGLSKTGDGSTVWSLLLYNGLSATPSNVVNGPSSSTDNTLARWDSTTGKVLQDGKTVEDDNGNVTVNGTFTVTGTLTASGGVVRDLLTKTGTYTLTTADHVCVATSGSFTIALPTAAGNTGLELEIVNAGAGTITVNGDGTETINGNLSVSLNPGDSLTVKAVASNWRVT